MACNMEKLIKFSKDKQELIAMCVDNYTDDMVNFASAKVDFASIDGEIRKRFSEVMGGADFNHRTYRKYKNEIFEIVEIVLDQTLPEGWADSEFFNRFVETKRLDLGDKNEFYAEENSLLTVSRFSGNHWNTVRERFDLGTGFSIPTSWYNVHFYNDFERFMKNIDSFSRMLDKARKSFNQSFQDANYVAFSGMSEVAPEGFAGHGTLSTDAEKENLLAIIEKVETATRTRPTLVGSNTALRKLQGNITDNWIPETSKTERQRNGVVSTWEGYELLSLPQVFKKGTFDFELSTTKLLIIGGEARPIKFVYEGNSRINEVRDNTTNRDQTLEEQIQTKAGVGVVADSIFGSWDLA